MNEVSSIYVQIFSNNIDNDIDERLYSFINIWKIIQ